MNIKESKTKMIRAACHICGEPWDLPPYIAEQYGPDRPYECTYCINKIRRMRSSPWSYRKL